MGKHGGHDAEQTAVLEVPPPRNWRLRAPLNIGLEHSELAHTHLLVLLHVPQVRATFEHHRGAGGNGQDGRRIDYRGLECMQLHALWHLY